MIHWIIFSTLASGLFYGLYCLTLRRDRWLQLSRVYLIIMMAFSLGYPLVRMPEMVEVPHSFIFTYPAPLVTLTSPSPISVEEPAASPTDIDWTWWLSAVYFIGLGIMLLIMLIQFGIQAVRIWRLPTVAYLDDDTAPYSFFNHIIIGTRAMSDEELACVLAHEQEHAQKLHTLDVLLMRLMCCVAWFNPFAWLMLHELRAVHEYQADAAVQTGKVYLKLLYKQTTGFGYGHITNNFNSIKIKKRITMMNKSKSRFGAWKALAALPVAALLMMVGCQNAPLAGDTLDTPKYNVPDGSYLVSDGHVSYVDVFKDGHLVSRHLDGMVEIPLDRIGEMDILYDTSSFAIVDKAAEKHKEYKYVRVTRLKDMAEPPDVVTDYYELCYSNDSTCQVAREINGESVSTLPTYIGGEEAMYKYISENLRYPEQAKADGIAGKVHVSFVVEKDGSVTDVEVVRGIGHGCDEEAVRVVKSMPRWTPGTLFGKPVRVHYNIPFSFKLQ